MGSMTCFTPKIITNLLEHNFSVRICHFGQVKPLIPQVIHDFLTLTKILITIEEHNVLGGFGAQICRIAGLSHSLPILTIGVEDRFGQSGKTEELYEEYGISPSQIIQKIIQFAKAKDSLSFILNSSGISADLG